MLASTHMKQRKAICTIATAKNFAQVKVLAQSVSALHPGLLLVALIIDDISAASALEIEDNENIKIIPVKKLLQSSLAKTTKLPIYKILFQYLEGEAWRALKPVFLHYLLTDLNFEKILYVDCSYKLFGSLHPFWQRLSRVSFVVIPNLSALDHSEVEQEQVALRTGVFNTSFIGLRNTREALAFLRWWQSRLPLACSDETRSGVYYDQRWFELILGKVSSIEIMTPGEVICSSSFLRTTPLRLLKNTLLVGKKKVLALNFSLTEINTLSKSGRLQKKFADSSSKKLSLRLINSYKKMLKGAGHQRYSKLPYSLNYWSHGVEISRLARQVMKSTDFTSPSTNPFETSAADSFYKKLLLRNHRLLTVRQKLFMR